MDPARTNPDPLVDVLPNVLATAPPTADTEPEVRVEHLRALLAYAPVLFFANLSAGITLTVGLWSSVPPRSLLLWLTANLLLNALRWKKARAIRLDPADPATVGQAERLFLVGVLLSGSLWGSAGNFFYVPGQPTQGIFLALVLIAMSAAATTALSFHRFAYPLFMVPAIAPLLAQLIVHGGRAELALGLVMPLYFALLMTLSRQIYRFTHDAIVGRLERERHALTDPLTAVANRRAFQELLEKEWQRGLRTRRPLALIIADVDDFKRYNDTYGHAAGDRVLRRVAGVFRQGAHRVTDLVARIGGEELAVVLPETDLDGAAALAERIRALRAQAAGEPGLPRPIPTVSFGVCAAVPDAGDSVEALFERADMALYRAKSAGKDCVRCCPPEPAP